MKETKLVQPKIVHQICVSTIQHPTMLCVISLKTVGSKFKPYTCKLLNTIYETISEMFCDFIYK